MKFGKIVEGNVLNNILNCPADGGEQGIQKGLFQVFPKYLKK